MAKDRIVETDEEGQYDLSNVERERENAARERENAILNELKKEWRNYIKKEWQN